VTPEGVTPIDGAILMVNNIDEDIPMAPEGVIVSTTPLATEGVVPMVVEECREAERMVTDIRDLQRQHQTLIHLVDEIQATIHRKTTQLAGIRSRQV
jgi:SepF-like predicted cell division protein (DUF552 family)